MPFTVLQISDCHLGDEPGDCLLGLNTDDSLSAVLSLVKAQCAAPDLVVFTGDISNTGGAYAYPRLQEMFLAETGITAPALWLPGNHDDNALMHQAVGAGFLGSETLGQWQVTCLDSSIPKAVPGDIAPSELSRSVAILENHADKHHLFFIHHHLQPIGCAWLDPQLIANAEQVMAIWGEYKHLKLVAHGHVHQVQRQQFSHVEILSAPSTCIQFKPNSDEFAMGEEMPGFRVFTLHDDGRYESQLHRISQRDLGIDYSAQGY